MRTDTPLALQNSPVATDAIATVLAEAIDRLGVDATSPDRLLATLPFADEDCTGGSEIELQVAVRGRRDQVDLPLTIEASRYVDNLLKRARSGEHPEQLIHRLEAYLNDNRDGLWENSAVRFPLARLHPYTRDIFEKDLLADKNRPDLGRRGDSDRYLRKQQDGSTTARVPVSYLIKLALAEVIGRQRERMPLGLRQTAQGLLDHFLNDNTSPESYSFHVVPLRPEAGNGKALARETAKRYLLTALLVRYANHRFGLQESGQEALIHFAPQPPQRQRLLNDLVPDTFYRELFMSPCLSGWDRGEEKHHYMHLCHQVLSRSQLNAVAKLREAGIITSNLVVLPNLSNTSLANNGVHVSLGSRRLGRLRRQAGAGFAAPHEKCLGDLAIKIIEHFLPLFVGTFSAAPYRLDFADFHPERVLGFLPHELDYTHLRMLWRRWRKKATLSVFGRSLTPFGPHWLDRRLSGLFGLKGDFLPDFRLLDYPVCFMSTASSPALDGRQGNHQRLLRDLNDMGITDSQMSLYLFLKPREFDTVGFSGVEARHYSLFHSFGSDLGNAVSLQQLLSALAYKYIVTGQVTHADIPDDPQIESERRQIFFGAAIDLPTVFIRQASGNRLLQRILRRTANVRASRRYPGYLRVGNLEYRRALLAILLEDAAELIEAMRLGFTLENLKLRLDFPAECSTAGKLTRMILDATGARQPLDVGAVEFNQAAEKVYRDELSTTHLAEALTYLERDLQRLEQSACQGDSSIHAAFHFSVPGQAASSFLKTVKGDLLAGRLGEDALLKLINLTLFTTHRDQLRANRFLYES
ncbi:MAG: hypothetical protein RQ723_09720 [Desulfuromonadales bacterium]|nr:hypothetical protein [Desulfuromonadales bacterium]